MNIAYIGAGELRGGRAAGRFQERLRSYEKAARELGHRLDYASVSDISIRSHPTTVFVRGKNFKRIFDCAIIDNTSGGMGAISAMQTFRFFDTLYIRFMDANIAILNDDIIQNYATSKFQMISGLSSRNIRVAKTYLFHNNVYTDRSMIYKSLSLGPPFVIKPDILANGIGVRLIGSERDFVEYLEAVSLYPMDYLAQEFIRNQPSVSTDTRVFVSARRIIGAITRRNNHPVCSNLNKGGKATYVNSLKRNMSVIAEKAAKIIGGDFYSLDIIENKQGHCYVNELEVNPDPELAVLEGKLNLYREKIGAIVEKTKRFDKVLKTKQ